MEQLRDSIIQRGMETVPIRLLFSFKVEVGAMASHLNMLQTIATEDLKQGSALLPILMMFGIKGVASLVTSILT